METMETSTTTKTNRHTEAAARFLERISDTRFKTHVEIRRYNGSKTAVVQVACAFQAHNTEQYCQSEQEQMSALYSLATTERGSIWGTDSGSVGGHSGLTNGYCRLSRSGVSLACAKAIAKELGIEIGRGR